MFKHRFKMYLIFFIIMFYYFIKYIIESHNSCVNNVNMSFKSITESQIEIYCPSWI